MNKIAEIINLTSATSSSNDKLYILKKNENVPGLKEVLRFIYNPYCRTGISDKKLDKAMTMGVASTDGADYMEAIRYFSTHTTGSDIDLAYAARFIRSANMVYGPACQQLAKAIVTQDLKIGITATSLNKVYGSSFIPKIGCMLGTLYGDVGPTKTKWPCIVTEKLDGIRRILIKENGTVKAYSRSGHEDTDLVEIFEEAKYLPDNMVYDGELLAIGNYVDNIAVRQATNSIANSSGTKRGLTFNVFDMVPIDDFFAGVSKQSAINRKLRLNATFGDEGIIYLDPENWYTILMCYKLDRPLKFIKVVPILGLVKNINEVEPIVSEIWKRGGEGVMLNSTVGKYEIKRSKELLKVKHTEEHILTVIRLVEGTGKFEGMLGSLVVDYKGNKLGVGSGFTDDQRIIIWNKPADYIGRKVEIETFGESTNALGDVSLNCPIFKRFVGVLE